MSQFSPAQPRARSLAEGLRPEAPLRALARRFPADLGALVLMPVVLTALTSSWTFLAPTGYIDPYLYTGYFLDLKGYLNFFAGAYYGSRLPWLLLGNAVYSVAPPDLANTILRFMLFYCATFAMYGTFRLVWRDRLVATVTAILLGLNPYFLRAINWDYINGPAYVAMLLALLCLTAAARKPRWRPLLFCAGMLLTTAVSIHFFLLVLIPVPVMWYVVVNSRDNRNNLTSSTLFLVFGALTAFGAYGAINDHLAGQFNYLQPQIDLAGALDSPSYHTSFSALSRHQWLKFPAVAFVASFGLIIPATYYYLRGRHFRDVPNSYVFGAVGGLQMLLVAAVFFYYQFSGKHALLEDYPYANYLIPFSIIAIGSGVALGLSGAGNRLRMTIGILAALAMLVPFILGAVDHLSLCDSCLLVRRVNLIAGSAALLLVAAAWFKRASLTLLALVCFAALNAGTSVNSAVVYFSDQDRWHDRFLMVYDANSAMEPFNEDSQLRLWYNNSEPLAGVYSGVVYLHLGAHLIGDRYPELSMPRQTPLRAGQKAAILTSGGDPTPIVNQIIASAGLQVEVIDQTVIQRGVDAFNVYILRAFPKGIVSETTLPVNEFTRAQPGAKVAVRKDGTVRVATLPIRWSYSGLLKVGGRVPPEFADYPAAIHLRVRSVYGLTGVGVLKRDRSGWIDSQPVGSGRHGFVDVYLAVPRIGDASDVVVMNWARDGVGVLDIAEVTLVLLAPEN